MIIVTGANGFIGSVIVWELNQAGLKDIICVDSVGLNERNLLKKRQYSRFLDKNQIWDFLKTPEAQQKIDWIIHMGACSSTTETNEAFLNENNTEYSNRLFDWCAQYNKGLIYASSAATYGDGKLGFDDETAPELLKPLNLYGKSKVLSDIYAVNAKQTPPHWYGLKFFNVFGPNEYHKGSMSSVAYKAFHQIKDSGSLGLFKSYHSDYKDGEQKRDFVYVKEVSGWILELMNKKPKNGIYNMGFGRAHTWLDLASAVFKAMDKEMKINWLEMPENIRDQYQYFTLAKTSKWLSSGMSPSKWPLDKAVADYVQNYLNHSDPQL